jgi:hypothetical protein
MRSAVMFGALALCLLTGLAPLEAQGLKTTVTGPAPFTLGVSVDEVLRVDPALQPGAFVSFCPSRVHTVDYQTQITAPIGEESYTAALSMCFYQGRLGLILIKWLVPEIEAYHRGSDTSVISIALALATQLTNSYAPQLIKKNSSGKAEVRVEIVDAQGNALEMRAGTADPYGITLAYWWGPFIRAVKSAPSVPMRLLSY